MLITVETTEPIDDTAAEQLLSRLNDTTAYADLEVLLHFEQVLMLSGTDLMGQRAAQLSDSGQAPLEAQLVVARSQAFYTAAGSVSTPTAQLAASLRQVHIETLTEHIVLSESAE